MKFEEDHLNKAELEGAVVPGSDKNVGKEVLDESELLSGENESSARGSFLESAEFFTGILEGEKQQEDPVVFSSTSTTSTSTPTVFSPVSSSTAEENVLTRDLEDEDVRKFNGLLSETTRGWGVARENAIIAVSRANSENGVPSVNRSGEDDSDLSSEQIKEATTVEEVMDYRTYCGASAQI